MLNTATHGAGAVLALVAAAVLITLAAVFGDVYALVGASIYGVSLLLLYVSSTLYHAARSEPAKSRLKVFDHCMIFVLIAGTYTPFTLTGLRGSGGYTLLALVWTLALIGVIFKLYYTGRFRWLSTGIYIGMGWLIVIAIEPLQRSVPPTAVIWLFLGGAAYTLGTIFYMSRRLPYGHAIWHGFVLAGSACHYVAIVIQVLATGVQPAAA